MGFFDSKTKSKSETQTTPWWYAAQGLQDAAQLVSGQMGTPLEFFPGQTYAGQTDAERQAIEALKQGAGAYPDMLGGFMDPATNAWQGALGAPGSALGMGLQDVANNPALMGAADAIQGRVNRNLQENILPGMTEQFMGYGGLGGTRQGVAEGIAGRGTSDVLAEQLANMYGNAWAQGLGAETSRYNAGLGAQAGAIGQLPMMADMGLSEYTQPAALLGQAGLLERSEEQRAIDEDMARFQFNQMEPYQRAGLGLGLLMDPAQAFGQTKSKSETKNQPSTWSNIGSVMSTVGSLIGAGMTGGMSGVLGGMAGMGGAAGAGAGAGASSGGFMPGFSGGMGSMGFNPYGRAAGY